MVFMPLRWMLPMVLCMAGLAWAQSATQPADQASAPAAAARQRQVRQWLSELADPQASARERAREALMGLNAQELPILRAAIRDARSLEPSQAAVLPEIVTHVFLTGQPYERSDSGFVGVTMPNRMPDPDGNRPEVIVESRLPGFPGYRWLRDGDAIVDIEERPMPQPMGQVAFTTAISAQKPGAVVHLKVLRQGKVTRVPVRLDARPALQVGENALNYGQRVEDMMYQRTLAAEQYWKDNFASLVEAGSKLP